MSGANTLLKRGKRKKRKVRERSEHLIMEERTINKQKSKRLQRPYEKRKTQNKGLINKKCPHLRHLKFDAIKYCIHI